MFDDVSQHGFVDAFPVDANSFRLQAGRWKYDFEDLDRQQIIERGLKDGRPRFCAETFEDFRDLRIIELGPSDGYNTLGLELQGATEITSIEANVGAFIRCLIMKNAFNLRAKFLLGDFLKFLNDTSFSADLVYASGVLYHLDDPLSFLSRCGEASKHLFLWSFVYNEAQIEANDFERKCFRGGDKKIVQMFGRQFIYHTRYYQPEIVADPKYSGGIGRSASWLSKEDLFAAVEYSGFEIRKYILDNSTGIDAYNILASKR